MLTHKSRETHIQLPTAAAELQRTCSCWHWREVNSTDNLMWPFYSWGTGRSLSLHRIKHVKHQCWSHGNQSVCNYIYVCKDIIAQNSDSGCERRMNSLVFNIAFVFIFITFRLMKTRSGRKYLDNKTVYITLSWYNQRIWCKIIKMWSNCRLSALIQGDSQNYDI